MANPVDQLIRQRRSVRAYLPDPVNRETIEAILVSARCAPSGANLQPGHFHVLVGQALLDLNEKLIAAVDDKRPIVSEYSYFPETLSAELKSRQHAAGFALYDALGIAKRDTAERRKQFNRNFRFFDAPVGMVVTIQRSMGKGCFMDLGMSLMNLQLSAVSHGLGSSGIGALANYADVVHEHLGLPAADMVVCGIALGKPDESHPVNTVRTERETLKSFATFHGF